MPQITIDKQKLERELNSEFKDMRRNPHMEETRISLLEINGIHVQVLLTRDDWEKVEDETKGIATISD